MTTAKQYQGLMAFAMGITFAAGTGCVEESVGSEQLADTEVAEASCATTADLGAAVTDLVTSKELLKIIDAPLVEAFGGGTDGIVWHDGYLHRERISGHVVDDQSPISGGWVALDQSKMVFRAALIESAGEILESVQGHLSPEKIKCNENLQSALASDPSAQAAAYAAFGQCLQAIDPGSAADSTSQKLVDAFTQAMGAYPTVSVEVALPAGESANYTQSVLIRIAGVIVLQLNVDWAWGLNPIL
jgi:hypothetical protein